MLTINVRTSPEQAVSYFHQEFRHGDYYAQEGVTPGVWLGKGAERLGLSGEIVESDYENLCYNRTPDGKDHLTPVTREERRVAYDFTFNAPKSVSLAHLLENDPVVLRVFQEAVRATMEAVERDMRTRVRRGGADHDRVTGNLLAAEFLHTTSRPVDGIPDPHLHAHVVVMNATFDDEEGRWKAAQFGELKAEARYYQAIFHLALSNGLAKEGYTTERVGDSWEVGGIGRPVIDAFSRRTKEINEEIVKRGIIDPKVKADMGRRTRKSKSTNRSREETYAEWKKMAEEAGYKGVSREGARNHTTARAAIEFALAKGFERSSVLSEKMVLADAMREALGSKVTLDELHHYFENRPGLIHRIVDDHGLLTSQEVLAQEKFCLDYARKGLNTLAPLKPGEHKFVNDKLTKEQKAAAMHLFHSTDRVTMVNGAAGVGKTQLLQEVIPAIKAAGVNVVVMAPTVDASRRVLRDDGFKDADTVARFLVDPAMQHRARNGVLVVDEAGLLSMPTMARLMEEARAVNARIHFIGDSRQHGSVERGDGMRTLESEAGIKPAVVRGIKRQKDPVYREAVQHLADGRTLQGYKALQKMGVVLEIPDDAQRMQALANEYVRAIRDNKTVLVIAPTHAEGRIVNTYVRERLREEVVLTGEDRKVERLQRMDWTRPEQSDPNRYKAGHVIQFQRGTVGFVAGERAEATGRIENGQIEVRRANGSLRLLNMKASKSFSVFEKRSFELAVGDKIRITDKGLSDRIVTKEEPTRRQPHERRRKNLKTGLNKGRVLTVTGFTKEGAIETAENFVLRPSFGHFNHAYVYTSHASQGTTVDRILIAESVAHSSGAINRAQFYVSASRAREEVRVFTDNAAALQQRIQRSAARQSATQLASQPLTMAMAEHLRIRRQQEEATYPQQQLAARIHSRRVQQARSPQQVRQRGRSR